MRSESTSALGQPRLTKPTFGVADMRRAVREAAAVGRARGADYRWSRGRAPCTRTGIVKMRECAARFAVTQPESSARGWCARADRPCPARWAGQPCPAYAWRPDTE